MKTATGLICLGLVGGTLPAGLAGMSHLGGAVLGAVGALVVLLGTCLVAPGPRAPSARDTARVPGVHASTVTTASRSL